MVSFSAPKIVTLFALFIAAFLFAYVQASTEVSTETSTEGNSRSCTPTRFERCDFYIQGVTYLPTEYLRTVPFDTLRQSKSNRLMPPFPKMLGETPKETFLGEVKERLESLKRENNLQEGQMFTNAFWRPQSLFGHIFPDEHKQVFFFPLCCDLKGKTEASVRNTIQDLINENFFDGWWQDATTDLLERLFYEYNVFGSCDNNKDVRTYFQTIKDQFNALNLPDVLEKAEISPNVNQKLTATQVRNTIREILDVQVALQCIKDPVEGKYLLHQIWLCYDDKHKLIDCPLQLQSEESCTRSEKGLLGKYIDVNDFYMPSWEDAKRAPNQGDVKAEL